MAHVSRVQHLNASASDVWATIGEFGNLGGWHPAVVKQTNEGDTRHLELPDGAVIVEESLGTDAHSYAYAIVSGPLPVEGYRSSLSVASAGAGSVVVWTSTFTPTADGAADVIAGVYEAGFGALVDKFGA